MWEGGEREEGGKEGEREEGGKEGEREEGEGEGGGVGRKRKRRGGKREEGKEREKREEREVRGESATDEQLALTYKGCTLYVFTTSSRNTRVFEEEEIGSHDSHMTSVCDSLLAIQSSKQCSNSALSCSF